MGCFGGGDTPTYTPAKAPDVKQAQPAFQGAIDFAQQYFPQALGAQETGIGKLGEMNFDPAFFAQYGANLNPIDQNYFNQYMPQDYGKVTPEYFNQFGANLDQITPEYYDQFAPSSFEQALGNQYFQNIMPNVEEGIRQSLSTSGMAYSPLVAEQIGQARGQVGYDVGKYLSDLSYNKASDAMNRENQMASLGLSKAGMGLGREDTMANLGMQQALQALGRDTNIANLGMSQAGIGAQGIQNQISSLLGIDPFSVYGNYALQDLTQSNLQAGYDYDAASQKAMADYQAALQKQQEQQAKISSLMSMGGMAAGAIAAPFTGGLSLLPAMAMGSSIGQGVAPVFGGSANPDAFGNAYSVYQGTQKSSLDKYLESLIARGQTGGI